MRDLKNIKEYKVVKNKYNIILNANESPFDFPEELKKKALKELEGYNWNRYPPQVMDELYSEIERFYNVKREQIFFSNGSDEIFSKILFLCEKKDIVISTKPTFEMYKIFSEMYDLEYIEVPLNPDFSFNCDKILELDGKILFIASPNSPTGTIIDEKSLIKILENFNGLVVLDEAYAEFSTSYSNFIQQYDNLIVTRTFSKAYSLAGIRLGYAISNKKNISLLKKVNAPYSVNLLSQVIALTSFRNRSYIEQNITMIKKERKRIYDFLKRFFEVAPSEANFLFFKAKDANLIYEELLKKGILIRKFDSMDNYLRVTIGTELENNKFIEAMKGIINEIYR